MMTGVLFDFSLDFWCARGLMTASLDRCSFRASTTLSAEVSSSLLLGLLLTGVGIRLPTTSG